MEGSSKTEVFVMVCQDFVEFVGLLVDWGVDVGLVGMWVVDFYKFLLTSVVSYRIYIIQAYKYKIPWFLPILFQQMIHPHTAPYNQVNHNTAANILRNKRYHTEWNKYRFLMHVVWEHKECHGDAAESYR